ncbi:mucin-1 [Streptomyces sp. TR02-1]|uniref:mucin-1 n=1 Tax=Streptomyces sp. TR02-1 TaxID=3385977 RepID=UPI00399F9DCA
MRYAPPGLCLNDFDLQHVDGEWRLLHLQAPPLHPFDASVLETSYGHAASSDLVNWTPLPPAFGIGRPGAFDDSAVWTMHQVPTAEGSALFYTGVSQGDDGGARQAVGLAFSDRRDGTGWRRANGGRPVVTADPAWYRTGPDMAWRDPFVVRDDAQDRWLMVICARVADGPAERSGCVGTATSTDLLHWTAGPPLLVPGDIDEFECPVLERVADGWLLIGSIGPDHDVHTWHAPDLSGPWAPQGRLGPAGIYAPRLTSHDGRRLLLHTLQRRHGLTDTGPLGRGVLAQPKVLHHTPGTAPQLLWWEGSDRHLQADRAEGAAEGDTARDGCLDAVFDGPVADFSLRLRGDGTGDGKGAVLLEYRNEELTVSYPDGTPLAGTAVPAAPARSLRVLHVGEYVEVYLDDVFVLATCAYEPSGDEADLTVGGAPHPLRRRRLAPADRRDDVGAVRTPAP